MVDVKLGNKIFSDVHTVKLNTTANGTVLFSETTGNLGQRGAVTSAVGAAGLAGAKANTRLGRITVSAVATITSE